MPEPLICGGVVESKNMPLPKMDSRAESAGRYRSSGTSLRRRVHPQKMGPSVSAFQGQSKSSELIQSGIYDFLLVIYSNWV